MDDALRMRGDDGIGDVARIAKRSINREPAGRNAAIERHARDVLHHDEREVAVLLHGVDRDAVRMIQGRGRTRLVEQSFGRVGVASREDLDRHGTVEHRVVGTVHRRHPTLAKACVNRVVQEGRSDHRLGSSRILARIRPRMGNDKQPLRKARPFAAYAVSLRALTPWFTRICAWICP